MQEWLIQTAQAHQYIIYIIIVAIACAEGPILSLLFGVLIKLGYFSLLPVYAALMIGDLIGDIAWYYIGRYWGHSFIKKYGKYFSITEQAVAKVEKIFHKNKHSILFLSKISNGLGFALVTLMTAGMVRIPFWKYLSINIVGQFVWSGLLIGIGYFFGNLYIQVDDLIGRMTVIAGFIILFVAFIGYKKYLKTKAEQYNI